jgi:hypothetical protein
MESTTTLLRKALDASEGQLKTAHLYLMAIGTQNARSAERVLTIRSRGYYERNGMHPSRFTMERLGLVVMQADMQGPCIQSLNET